MIAIVMIMNITLIKCSVYLYDYNTYIHIFSKSSSQVFRVDDKLIVVDILPSPPVALIDTGDDVIVPKVLER